MSVVQHINKLKLLMAGLFITLPLALHAGDGNLPQVPKAKQQATQEYGCVNPVEDMRKNHMEYLLHQRDKTMHQGIRTTDHSLAECVECHVTQNASGNYPEFGDSEHFCSSCHNYVAVSIDCFQCHNDKPQQTGSIMSEKTMPVDHRHNFVLNEQSATGTTLEENNSGSNN